MKGNWWESYQDVPLVGYDIDPKCIQAAIYNTNLLDKHASNFIHFENHAFSVSSKQWLPETMSNDSKLVILSNVGESHTYLISCLASLRIQVKGRAVVLVEDLQRPFSLDSFPSCAEQTSSRESPPPVVYL